MVSYNQEVVVEEAVRSVFAQDYGRLEIILSDDCSADRTFDILQRMASEYEGPHEVRLNRNPANMGIGKHWDTISRTASGDLIVHAAGDDISLPSRVTRLVEAWMSIKPRPTLISSDGLITTYSGEAVRRHIGTRWSETVHLQRAPRAHDLDLIDVPVCGFSMAVDRKLYEVFEPIQDRLWAEDEMLRRRAVLLRGIMYIPDVLVRYRDRGLSKGAEKTQLAFLNLYRAQAASRLSIVSQTMRDITMVSCSERDIYYKILLRQERSAIRRSRMILGNVAASLVMLVRQVAGKREYGITKLEYLKFFMVRWIPRLFFILKDLKTGMMR